MWKSVFYTMAALVVGLTGCQARHAAPALPEPPPLGREYRLSELAGGEQAVKDDALPPPCGTITLRDASAYALLHNPDLAVYSWEIRVRQAKALQAGLYPNPELEVELEEVGRTSGRAGFEGSQASLVLGQLIDLTNKPGKRREIALLETSLAGWDYEAQYLAVYGQVTGAFVDVLAAQRMLTLRQEQVDLAERVLAAVTERVEIGKDAPMEQTKASIALAETRIDLTRAQHRLEAARKILAATWGSQAPQFDAVAGDLELLWAVPSSDVLFQQLGRNPALARWPTKIEQREDSIGLEESRAIPDPVVFGGLQQFNEDDETAFIFGVTIPLPVWDRNQGNILAARHGLSQARAQQRAVESALMAELAGAYETLASAYAEAADLKNEIVPRGKEVFEATGQAYRGGKVGYLEVLDAQRTFFTAKARHIESLAAYHKARAAVEQLIAAPLDAKSIQDQPDAGDPPGAVVTSTIIEAR